MNTQEAIKKTITIEISANNNEEMEANLEVFVNDINFLKREYDSNIKYIIKEGN